MGNVGLKAEKAPDYRRLVVLLLDGYYTRWIEKVKSRFYMVDEQVHFPFWEFGRWRLFGGFVGAGEVGFGLGFSGVNLEVDGAALVVEFGAIGVFGD